MDSVPPVEHFSLRWNNFQSTITSALAGLRDTQAFVDVTLWTDGRQIKAHRNVLSACSPVLLELLKDNPCAHPIIILRDVTHADLSAIVTYMYQGEVNVAPEALRTFLHTAQLLKVKGLADTGIQQEVSRSGHGRGHSGICFRQDMLRTSTSHMCVNCERSKQYGRHV
ncbi:Broad-complex core protein isoforms 1/2/3/4/5 [Amphibalanus amphitrite]|uniref:Broad-complex core protein isoforms 1/2/3/4/5 n=1 Tax=Amphibalanus amphitrite TaxID=1232801 RepID=A0A6A4WDK5_AMPAM|nr:Broad-complex core protein isoforms 1/2/3/4/5 [Amphibalanus amphitrite]